jgi:inward rectifier potassium channel
MSTPRVDRVFNPDGSHNLVRLGMTHSYFSDLYHAMMAARWGVFFGLLLALYAVSNAVFAVLYRLGGDCIENARAGSLTDAFFFSVQTMATIGYGKMVPKTEYANVLVSLEALIGMLFISMATGLMFAKFSRPRSQMIFSKTAVIAPRDGVTSLMFRVANRRPNLLIEGRASVTLARDEMTPEGERLRRLHDLPLTRAHNIFFPLSWLVIHQITPESPLSGVTREALEQSAAEIIIGISAVDDESNQTIYARYSYVASEIQWDVRFADILSRLPDGRRCINYTKFHDVIPAKKAA